MTGNADRALELQPIISNHFRRSGVARVGRSDDIEPPAAAAAVFVVGRPLIGWVGTAADDRESRRLAGNDCLILWIRDASRAAIHRQGCRRRVRGRTTIARNADNASELQASVDRKS